MSSKRDHTALSYSDTESTPPQSSNKRQRSQTTGKAKAQEPKTDLTYGQRCVFPGLNESTLPVDDDLDFEDEADALAYLRSVRTEASEIPHLLVAPKAGPQLPPHLGPTGDGADRSIYQSGVGDSRGYYYDGAYTAAPDVMSSEDEGEYQDPDDPTTGGVPKKEVSTEAALRDAYFASLMRQFNALRSMLHQPPPSEALDALPGNHETEVGFFGAKSSTFRKWTQRLRYTDPLPAQVAAMDRQSALRLLRILLGGKFLRRGIELRERTSRWIWALLARLPDRGELDHVEVGWIRELGKRAVLMMVSIAQMAALREEIEVGLDGEKLQEEEEDDEIDEEFLGEMHPDVEDGENWVGDKPAKQDSSNRQDDETPARQATEGVTTSPSNADIGATAQDEGEADMDLEMEDGEVPDEPTTATSQDQEADIAAVKARLLAQLDAVEGQDESAVNLEPELDPSGERQARGIDANDEEAYDETRARINMRATLNMILTVAGEFYGQRDLLEFRDPFTGL